MMFSVITVSFNNLDGLVRTYESLCRQECSSFEWIVIDGGSIDDSLRFLQRVELPNYRFVSEADSGIFDAMNKGIALADGSYCLFLNAGDVLASDDVLGRAAKELSSQQPDLGFGHSLEENAQGSRLFKKARNPFANSYSMFTHHQAIFYSLSVLRDIGGYDLSYRFSADWALTTRVLSKIGKNWLLLNFPVCIFERGGVSQQKKFKRLINAEHYRILRNEAKMGALRASAYWIVKVCANKVRAIAPNLYDQLRFRRS